jgi:hypothetical protein
MGSEKMGCGKSFLIILLIVILLYPAYLLILWVGTVLGYLGYNFFFYLDNLVQVRAFNPIVSHMILGAFFGFIWGTFVAVRKFKLRPILILIPFLGFIGIIFLLSEVNQPLAYDINESDMIESDLKEVTKDLYIVKTAVNLRSGPSTSHNVLLILEKGTRVELIEVDSSSLSSSKWVKIKYWEVEGYVNSSYLVKLVPE